MVFTFGPRSREKLLTCSLNLQRVAERAIAITPWDFCVVCGHRGEEEQEEAFRQGTSKKHWPDSRHNSTPSGALDFAPWVKSAEHPRGFIPWNDTGLFYKLAAVFQVAAKLEGVEVRSGSDWDRDGLTADQGFHDIGHIEEAL
jgi:peptidoglycan L-alanyl-D-glutamate endopeptidase CwlK